MTESTLCHVALITLLPGVREELKNDIYRRYQTLREDCGGADAGILYLTTSENLDTRKGVTWVELAFFRDNDALQAFRAHPKHIELTDQLRKVGNWVVGDYVEAKSALIECLGGAS